MMKAVSLNDLPEDWRVALWPYLDHVQRAKLEEFVTQEYAAETVYPPREQLLRAYKTTSFNDVRCVILGQDPYHEKGQACGLAFAVPAGTKRPASLRNILKEYEADLGLPVSQEADLAMWSTHGVLLLNTVLTVRDGQAGSHQNRGWEMVTDATIRALSARETPVAFILWGAPAGKKAALIDAARHIIIQSAHPSPLSAYRGFFGSRPFSRVNASLAAKNCAEIDWRLA